MSVPHRSLPDALSANLRQHAGARAPIVNRTRRVVREEALNLREQRLRRRSLWAPVLICSSLLMLICYAVWGLLDGLDVTPTSVPDASDQVLLLLLWLLPVTAFVLGLVWIRRERNRAGGEVSR